MERASREPPGPGGGEVDPEMYVHPRLFFIRPRSLVLIVVTRAKPPVFFCDHLFTPANTVHVIISNAGEHSSIFTFFQTEKMWIPSSAADSSLLLYFPYDRYW